MASKRRSKTVVKNAMNFPQNVSNFFTPLLAFTKANELEKRSERAYLEYPVCVVVFIVYVRPLLCFDDVFCDVDIFPSITTLLFIGLRRKNPLLEAKRESERSGDNLSIRSKLEIASV